MTFSEYNSHSGPLFQKLKILKVSDLIYLYSVLFMYNYYSNRLPLIFDNFFKSINKVHQYQTRLASKISYYLPKVRTNYGKFNIRFFGAKVWNSIDDSLKSKSRACFKNLLKELIISNYWLVHWCTLVFYFIIFLCVHTNFFLFSFFVCVSACVCEWNRVLFFIYIFCNVIAIFFSGWPSHLARLPLAISKWLCSVFHCYFFTLHVLFLL